MMTQSGLSYSPSPFYLYYNPVSCEIDTMLPTSFHGRMGSWIVALNTGSQDEG